MNLNYECPNCGSDSMYYNGENYECPNCDYIGDGKNISIQTIEHLSSDNRCPICGSFNLKNLFYDKKKQGHTFECQKCYNLWNEMD
jgi:ssDNA-binding Zn-finger/Zn-ribbon topoisomerase 1